MEQNKQNNIYQEKLFCILPKIYSRKDRQQQQSGSFSGLNGLNHVSYKCTHLFILPYCWSFFSCSDTNLFHLHTHSYGLASKMKQKQHFHTIKSQTCGYLSLLKLIPTHTMTYGSILKKSKRSKPTSLREVSSDTTRRRNQIRNCEAFNCAN